MLPENLHGKGFHSEELRKSPEKFIIVPTELPKSLIKIPSSSFFDINTFDSILEKERKKLCDPASGLAVNAAQFAAFISGFINGDESCNNSVNLPSHFVNFQNRFRLSGELSLITLDMDDLTRTNEEYSHLHGSVIC